MDSNSIKWDIIPPEIKNDNFYFSIINIISSDLSIKNIIEIGASSGEGSTEAIIIGNLKRKEQNPNKINIFSLEVCTERFNRLKARYDSSKCPYFHPLNMSSIALNEFPNKEEIIKFYTTTKTSLNNYPIDLVLSWYDKDKEYIIKNAIPQNGIEYIKNNYKIETFDLALIDGSEFTGKSELDKIYGSKYILLDDINAYKNFETHQRLKNDSNYKCIIEDYKTRNGYSIFIKN